MTGRNFFLLFSLCAVIPLAAAKLSLTMGWFANDSLNKGEWLNKEIQLVDSSTMQDAHWAVAYVQQGECLQSCEQALFILHQFYTGLGSKQAKVKPLVLTASLPPSIQSFPALMWLPFSATENLPAMENQFIILNQHGIAILHYAISNHGPDEIAKNIRSDLLRLMNYDRSRL